MDENFVTGRPRERQSASRSSVTRTAVSLLSIPLSSTIRALSLLPSQLSFSSIASLSPSPGPRKAQTGFMGRRHHGASFALAPCVFHSSPIPKLLRCVSDTNVLATRPLPGNSTSLPTSPMRTLSHRWGAGGRSDFFALVQCARLSDRPVSLTVHH